MSAYSIVRVRIDPHIKEEATVVLAAMGLTLSNAFRLLLTRVAHDKALPFDPIIPNAKTLDAMKKARRGKLPSFAPDSSRHKRAARFKMRLTTLSARLMLLCFKPAACRS